MNKTQLKEKCKQILNNYKPGQLVSKEDFVFLMDVFIMHPEWELKAGEGVCGASIMLTKYKTRCFMLHLANNSITDISYLQCFNGKNSKLKNIYAACRDAIKEVIIDFRDKNVVYGRTKCNFTLEYLTPENTHIDHYDLQFNHLVAEWLKGKNIDELHDKINTGNDDLDTGIYFTSEDIKNDFTIFHNANTNLRAVSRFANLSILK